MNPGSAIFFVCVLEIGSYNNTGVILKHKSSQIRLRKEAYEKKT